MDVTTEDRAEIIAALEREAARLQNLIRDYGQQKKSTNVVVRQMADEGAANMGERVKRLQALVTKLRGGTAK